MMGLPEGRKSFKIGLAVLIQYRRVTDTQPPSQPRCRSKYRAYYVARVKKRQSICKRESAFVLSKAGTFNKYHLSNHLSNVQTTNERKCVSSLSLNRIEICAEAKSQQPELSTGKRPSLKVTRNNATCLFLQVVNTDKHSKTANPHPPVPTPVTLTFELFEILINSTHTKFGDQRFAARSASIEPAGPYFHGATPRPCLPSEDFPCLLD